MHSIPTVGHTRIKQDEQQAAVPVRRRLLAPPPPTTRGPGLRGGRAIRLHLQLRRLLLRHRQQPRRLSPQRPRRLRAAPSLWLHGSTFFGRPAGRCSDGRLVIDFIAQHLGLPFVPPLLAHNGSFRQGANFAVSGSTALDAAFFHHLLPRAKKPLNTSLGVQLQWFESLKPSLCGTTQECETFFSRSLFVVGAFGANDYGIFVENSAAGITLMPLVPDVVGAISMAVERLIKHGATSLVVPGVIPFGCVPKILTGDSCLEEYNKLAMHHNLLLQEALDKLRVWHPDTTIVYADQFGPVMDMMESPARFGFEEEALLTPCCGGPGTLLCGDDGGNLCENPSARLFWDGTHPTEAAYHYMAHLLLRSTDDTTVRGASYTSL